MSLSADAIPTLSLTDPLFADQLGASFHRFGFAMIQDHGIAASLIAEAWDRARAFFALPDAIKRGYIVSDGGGQRGYTAFGTEIAKGADRSDLKEFWHVGRELTAGESLSATMLPNIWPDEITGFRVTFLRLYREMDRVGGAILSAIACHLGLPPDWFADKVRDGNSIVRLLHYPPISAHADGIRAAAHEDINLITLLLGAEEGGLQLLTRDGTWLPVDPPRGALVVNVGDMLQRLTNHMLPSTSHRVVNPPPDRRGVSRYSMPFFLHLRPEVLIEALPQCVTPDNPVREPPITADAYLRERLREIGLTSK